MQHELKEMKLDNLDVEKRVREVESRLHRVETLFNNYVFQSQVRDQYESSNFFCKGDSEAIIQSKKKYYVHFVDYLSVNSFKRI